LGIACKKNSQEYERLVFKNWEIGELLVKLGFERMALRRLGDMRWEATISFPISSYEENVLFSDT
jgi:hypothetical protein